MTEQILRKLIFLGMHSLETSRRVE